MHFKLSNLRQDYPKNPFSKKDLPKDPIAFIVSCFTEAALHQPPNTEVNAFSLSTATKQGIPSSRTVLLKEINDQGFVFFTDYRSRKAKELAENPHAAALIYWPWIWRQIRIEGRVEKVSKEESEEYFHSRPLGSRIAASISKQSSYLENRDSLEERFKKNKELFSEKNPPPYPEFWGGYCLKASKIEFWQGQPNRLHDRLLYEKKEKKWIISRLEP